MSESSIIPDPGTNEAVKQGCKCPVLDNAHGWGYRREGEFIYTAGCPIHWPNPKGMPLGFEHQGAS